MKREILKISDTAFRIILIVIGSIVSTLILLFSILALVRVQENDIDGASKFLFFIFLILGLSRLITFFKEKTKISLLRFIVLLVFDVAIGILVLFAKDNAYFYSMCGGLFCLTIIISRVFKLIIDHSPRSILKNAIIIALFVLLSVGLFIQYNFDTALTPIMIVCIIVIFTALFEVLSNAFSQMKLNVLLKIIIRTYALEIILGLLTMMVAAAIIFAYFDENIPTFEDGLWYSFAIVTTIGFGDFHAVSTIGRVVSVILGVYGLVVVAVITSIIVNFYNETAGKQDTKEIKDISNDDKDKKKKKKK